MDRMNSLTFLLFLLLVDSVINNSALARQQSRKEFVPKTFRPLQGRFQAKQNIGVAFLVKIAETCTGSLISRDWALTAAHCFPKLLRPNYHNINQNGDFETNFIDGSRPNLFISPIVEKAEGLNVDGIKQLWNIPLKLPHNAQVSNYSHFRLIEKVIMHKDIQPGLDLWKGSDIALVKLHSYGAQWNLLERKGQKVVPICLPTLKFADAFDGKDAVMAGYGRRENPFCMTDMMGPQAFEICGSPQYCKYNDPGLRKCGLDFIYKGKKRRSCMKTQPPSSQHPLCKKYKETHLKNNSLIDQVTHIYVNNSFIITCYPEKAENGWCSTRRIGNLIDQEPTYNHGWGYCSDDERFKNCNGYIDRYNRNTSDIHVQILDKSYCVKAQLENLRAEQPMLFRFLHDDPRLLSRVICAGFNHTYDFIHDKFVELMAAEPEFRPTLEQAAELRPYRINGGGFCYGDSGGPLWVYLKDQNDKNDDIIPVQMGIYSYMPWGTCSGAHEPSYFTYLPAYLDWIFQYVPEWQVCKIVPKKPRAKYN